METDRNREKSEYISAVQDLPISEGREVISEWESQRDDQAYLNSEICLSLST